MSEKKKGQEEQASGQGKETKTPASQAQEPKKPEATRDLIAEANTVADRLEKQNKEYKALIERQERIAVENTLGGSSEAGHKETTEEDKADEAARKQLEGTGYEDMLFPEKDKK